MNPFFESQVQHVTQDFIVLLENELEELRTTLFEDGYTPIELKRMEYGYLSLHCLLLGLRLLDSCRLTISEEEERRIFRWCMIAAGFGYHHLPSACMVNAPLFQLLRPTEDSSTSLGLIEPEEIGSLWQDLINMAQAYGVNPAEDEVRDILMPAALEQHDVTWPPEHFLCTAAPHPDAALLTGQRDTQPGKYLLGLLLSHLLQLSKLPYADVIRLYDAAGAIVATETLSYEERQLYKRLTARAQDITGPLKTQFFRPNSALGQQDRRLAFEYAFDVLRVTKSNHSALGNRIDEAKREQLWDSFAALDTLLEQTHPLNQIIAWAIGLKGLLLFQRAPGMPVSTEAELGHALTELPTHFAWREVAYSSSSSHALTCTLSIIEETCTTLRTLMQQAWRERQGGPKAARLSEAQYAQMLDILQEAALETGAIFRSLHITPHGERLKMLTPEGCFSRITPRWDAEETIQQTFRYQKLKNEITAQLTAEAPAEPVVPTPPSGTPTPALTPAAEPPVTTPAKLTLTPEILKVRQAVQGGHILLIGGEILEHHRRNLEQAFDATVEWIPSDRYEHGQQAAVRLRPGETRFAIVAIRWVSHAQSELRHACKELGIPCVMHPAGLNPVSIAFHTVNQIGRKLGAMPPS